MSDSGTAVDSIVAVEATTTVVVAEDTELGDGDSARSSAEHEANASTIDMATARERLTDFMPSTSQIGANNGALRIHYLHIFGRADGTADPVPFLGPDQLTR